MDLRTSEHPEPSHIHVPRPSHTLRGSMDIQSGCPGDGCVKFVDQREDCTSLETD